MPEPLIVYNQEDAFVLRRLVDSYEEGKIKGPLIDASIMFNMLDTAKPEEYHEYLSQRIAIQDRSNSTQLYRDMMFRVPFGKLPLFIHHKHPYVRLLVKWRLSIGK